MASHSAIYSFALSLPVYHLFDYEVDQDMPTTPGSRFLLPFGNRDRVGILVQAAAQDPLDTFQLKTARQALDSAPVLSEHMLKLLRWVADYYCQPVAELFRFTHHFR